MEILRGLQGLGAAARHPTGNDVPVIPEPYYSLRACTAACPGNRPTLRKPVQCPPNRILLASWLFAWDKFRNCGLPRLLLTACRPSVL